MSTTGDKSPSEDGNAANTGLSASKNKQCPFCHESFTSSSLGRHLDVYIKEKHPKAPDGIHNVEKIRQLRSAITRRQPRRNTRAYENGTADAADSSTGTPRNDVGSPYGSQANDKQSKWHFNKPTWEATGVITDIPSTPTLALDSNMRKHINRSDVALRKRMAEDRTRLRATELALQELLDSVNAARTQAYPESPYDFDFLSQTFPALCLRLLQQQPSLQSVQVIENPKYCPVQPPMHSHYELLMKLVQTRLEDFTAMHSQQQENSSDFKDTILGTSRSRRNIANNHDPLLYTAHLTQAWEVWRSTPEIQKVTQWNLEVFRALSSAQDTQKRLSDALAKAEAESEHLRVQIERLNECQQPKEFTFQIPSNWHITRETASALISQKVDVPPDRESLINKWTAVVRGNSKFQRALPELGLVDVSINPGELFHGSPEANGTQRDDQEDDGESVDEGRDEDENMDGGITNSNRMQIAAMPTIDRGMLDPGLRENGDMEVDMR